MLTCMKQRLFRSQKLTNEGAWEHAGPEYTSTSPAEQRSSMRVRLKAIKTGVMNYASPSGRPTEESGFGGCVSCPNA